MGVLGEPFAEENKKESSLYGKMCGECGKFLGPDAELWANFHGDLWYVLCEWCAQEVFGRYYPDRDFPGAHARCEGCNRLIHYPLDERRIYTEYGVEIYYDYAGLDNIRHTVTWCCRKCQVHAYAKRYKAKQRAKWERGICKECGAEFTRQRSTAQYCSPKCRQKAYRARQKTMS